MGMASEKLGLALQFTNKVDQLKSIASWQSLMQFARYGALGVVANVSGYTVYLGITHLGIGPKTAMTVLYCVGVCISFVGNRRWVFAGNDGMLATAAVRFLLAYAMGYLVNYGILAFFVDRVGYDHVYVQAVSIVVVALFLFITFKLLVFPHSSNGNGRGR